MARATNKRRYYYYPLGWITQFNTRGILNASRDHEYMLFLKLYFIF